MQDKRMSGPLASIKSRLSGRAQECLFRQQMTAGRAYEGSKKAHV